MRLMTADAQKKDMLDRLRAIVTICESKDVSLQEITVDYGIARINEPWGAVKPSHTGYQTITIKLRHEDKVKQHYEDVASALEPGIPALSTKPSRI